MANVSWRMLGLLMLIFQHYNWLALKYLHLVNTPMAMVWCLLCTVTMQYVDVLYGIVLDSPRAIYVFVILMLKMCALFSQLLPNVDVDCNISSAYWQKNENGNKKRSALLFLFFRHLLYSFISLFVELHQMPQ